MSFALIAGLVKEVGAPILTNILMDKFGRGGKAAGKVIETLADELGTPPRMEEIKDAAEADPSRFREVVRRVEASYVETAMAARDTMISYHGVLAGDQKAPDALTRLWRPLCGVAFVINCIMVVLTVCLMLLLKIALDDNLYPLVALVVPTLTLMAGVVGYYVHARTKEKTAGAA